MNSEGEINIYRARRTVADTQTKMTPAGLSHLRHIAAILASGRQRQQDQETGDPQLRNLCGACAIHVSEQSVLMTPHVTSDTQSVFKSYVLTKCQSALNYAEA